MYDRPDIVFCAQALARLRSGAFFGDHDRDQMLLGELRKLFGTYFDLTTWKLINTLPEEFKRKPRPILVGYKNLGVWVIRSAVWCNGDDWEAGDFESREAATGWWSVESPVTQDKIDPTNWLMETPDV